VNVLWVSPYPVFGGPHNAILQIAEPLRARGWESIVVLPDEPGNAAERLAAGGVETVLLPLHHLQATADARVHLGLARAFRSEMAGITKLLAERQCELVVLTGLDVQAAVAARRAGAAIVWQVLASRPPRPVRAMWAAMVRRWADAAMFSGEKIERLYVGRRPLGVSAYQWRPAADTRRFRPDSAARAAARARMGVPDDALFVGSVGNLVPMKGYEHFIRAAGLIHRRRPDSWFLISGSTYADHKGYRASLHREVRDSGAPAERFIWTEGPPDECYQALDLMMIASLPRSEGMPTTAIESMACETPVVATDVASIPEAVLDGITGVLVPPCDSEALADAALALANDPGKLQEFGAAGRRRVLEAHTIELQTEAHLQAFEAALSHRSGGKPFQAPS
jgi:glycosyltransferase involved in cell wall biosynthesis